MSDREQLLDLYLDDQLDAAERAEFEARIEGDAELKELVELQGQIDASLCKLAAGAPDPEEILARASGEAQRKLSEEDGQGGQILRPSFWRRPLMMVAAAAVVILAALLVTQGIPTGTGVATAPRLDEIYERELALGFKPDWVCETDAQFQKTFKKAFGQPLSLGEAPGVEALGLAYVNTPLSSWTVVLLAKVDGKEVMVFVDKLSRDDAKATKLAEGSSLKLHRRVIGELVAYEVSPFDAPRALALLERVH